MSKNFYRLLQACRKMQVEGCVMKSDNLPKEILGVKFGKNKCYPESYNCITKRWETYAFPMDALSEWRWYRVCANELFELYLQHLLEKTKNKKKNTP